MAIEHPTPPPAPPRGASIGDFTWIHEVDHLRGLIGLHMSHGQSRDAQLHASLWLRPEDAQKVGTALLAAAAEIPATVAAPPEPGARLTLTPFQVEDVEYALLQITRAIEMLGGLEAELRGPCEKENEAGRLEFLSDAIGRHVRDVSAVIGSGGAA